MSFEYLSRIGSLALLLACSTVALAQDRPVSVVRIPNPRPSGWITDTSNTVSVEAKEYINRAGDEVHESTKRELCVVVVDTIGTQNHRTFATDLFNHLSVGSPESVLPLGDWEDNGVMLFIAVQDRKAEIILGRGIDGERTIKTAQKIIDDHVVSNMKRGAPNSALYQGMRACATQLIGVSDLRAPVMLPSVSGEAAKPRGPKRQQRGPVTWWPWLAGAGLVGGVGLLIGGRFYYRYRPRQCESCDAEMVLLEEDQDDQFLDPGQQLEEHLGSVDYDVWACLDCEEVSCLRYGRFFTRYSRCPKCAYVTVHKIEKVLIHANYSHGGRVQVIENCRHCDYHRRYTYSTPKKVKSSNSGSGIRIGGGMGSGSSSSGFGGGRSAGGGASGSW